MTETVQRNHRKTRVIVLSLFIGGIVAGLLGIVSVAVARGAAMVGLLLIFGGVGAIAMAQLLELLMDIADHLAAIRTQVGKGVLGLLG